MRLFQVCLLATLSFTPLTAGRLLAHEFSRAGILVEHPWSRPTPPSAPVASGYVKLTNTGPQADRLLAVVSSLADRTEIHRTELSDGVAAMRPVGSALALAAGATLDFATERLHIMFLDPQRQLVEGERFPATLVFERAGNIDVEFVVHKRAAQPPAPGHTSHGGAQ